MNDLYELQKNYEEKLFDESKSPDKFIKKTLLSQKKAYIEKLMDTFDVDEINKYWRNISSIDKKLQKIDNYKNELKIKKYIRYLGQILIENEFKSKKSDVIFKYIKLTNVPRYLEILKIKKLYNKCEFCGSKNLIQLKIGSYLYCENCKFLNKFRFNHNIIDVEHSNIKNYFDCNYQKINYFKTFLDKLQMKKFPPDNVIDKINNEIEKRKIDRNYIDSKKIRVILKKLGLSKYYNDILYIITKVKNIELPCIEYRDIEKMKIFFLEVDNIWKNIKNKSRRSFINYSYYLYKTLEIISYEGKYDTYLEYLRITDTHKNIEELDNIWMKICERLNVKFFPTYL
jgi:hypothetical protein